MSLLDKIDNDLITALKNGEKEKSTVLRGLKSELKYKLIDKKDDLSPEEIMAVLSSAAKKRRESIEQFRTAERTDLADKEQRELDVIVAYLPQQLTEEELRPMVAEAIAESGIDSPKKIGLVMKVLMPRTKGRADGKLVNRLVNEALSK
ncbi:MAG: GatB/YqeY domain-containing protein [bacterium]|nr:GatB/YqeY domain-containing protein [bacterium]